MDLGNLKIDKNLKPEEFLNEFLHGLFKYKMEVFNNIEKYVNVNIKYFEKKYKVKEDKRNWKKEVIKNKKFMKGLMNIVETALGSYWKNINLNLYMTPDIRKDLRCMVRVLLNCNLTFVEYVKWLKENGHGLDNIIDFEIFTEYLKSKNIKRCKEKIKEMKKYGRDIRRKKAGSIGSKKRRKD